MRYINRLFTYLLTYLHTAAITLRQIKSQTITVNHVPEDITIHHFLFHHITPHCFLFVSALDQTRPLDLV